MLYLYVYVRVPVKTPANYISPPPPGVCRLLLKALLQFIGTLIWRNYTDNPTAAVTMSSLKVDMLSSLTQSVCQCLDVAGCPDYYDLPLLEKSLDCLLHLSARLSFFFISFSFLSLVVHSMKFLDSY